MSTTSNKTLEPRKLDTFQAIPEDEETPDELNRRLRKPGEPGFSRTLAQTRNSIRANPTTSELMHHDSPLLN